VAFALFLVGLFHAIRHRKLDLVHWSFLLMFLTYTWLSWRSVTGRVQAAGHLRHFVALAPFAALIALQGFNQWMRGIRSSVFTLGSLAVVVAVTGVFLSRTLEGELALPGPAEHLKLAIVAAIALIAVVRGTHYIAGLRQRWIKIAMIILTIGLSVGYLAARRSPIPVSHEREMIKSAATWYCGAGLQDRVTLCNHAWFRFFCDANHLLPEQCSSLTRASLAAAPAGAIAIWDGHYGHRLSGDVDLDYFRSDRNWRVHHRFHGPDVTQFFAVALEKIDGRGLRTTTPDRDRYENAGLGIQMDLAWALDWNIELREEGPVILTGAHRKIRLGVVLGFERYLGVFNDTRGYASTMNQEIAATRGVQLIETWMPETQPINALAAQGRQWARTRYLGGGYEHDVRVTVSARQGATLRVHFQYPPGHCEAVAKAVDDVVASLDLTGF
ncbi:MAG: hypothetical protein KAY24_05795, partial [Candidatus Eisenbacteria sp.]|nr:hypothetical protein [Candidatus Eisenbacteria bacterium]